MFYFFAQYSNFVWCKFANFNRDCESVFLSHSLVLVVAGFLFLYHLHGRTMLDVHVHQLLLYAIFGSAAVSFLEVFHRGNILMEMLRCTLTMLQGSWFWQVNLREATLVSRRSENAV